MSFGSGSGSTIGSGIGSVAGTAAFGPVGGAVGSLFGGAIGGLFGGGKKKGGGGIPFQPINLKTPNLDFTNSTPGQFDVRRINPFLSPERQGVFDLLSGQLSQVKPGFGDLSNAVREAFAGARRSALGDIRDSFAKRRIAGSSFASNQISNVAAEFGQKEAAALAQVATAEIQQSVGILQQQNSILAGAATEALQELNIGSNFVSNLQKNLNGIAGINAQLEFDANAAAGRAQGAQNDKITGLFDLIAGGNLAGGTGQGSIFGGFGPVGGATGPGTTGFQTGIGSAGFSFGL